MKVGHMLITICFYLLTTSSKVLLINILALFATVALGLQADNGNDLAAQNHPPKQLTLEDYQAVVEEIVKRDEGPSAIVPDVPTALYGALGPKDTCMIDCKEDFPKAFVCWWYNNTRCFSCNLTSEDQSCLNDCTCRKIGQTSGKSVAMPVILPGRDDDELAEIAKSAEPDLTATVSVAVDSKNSPVANYPFFCGNLDLTAACAEIGTTCSTEGIASSGEVCRKMCQCRNWDSSKINSTQGNPIKRDSKADLSGYPFACLNGVSEHDCFVHFTTFCTSGTLTSNKDSCRNHCHCANSSSQDTKKVRNIRPISEEQVGYPHCGSVELDADCKTHSTFCDSEGITSDSDVCRESCYCHAFHPTKKRAV